MTLTIVIIYCLALSFILFYSFAQLHLVFLYLRKRKKHNFSAQERNNSSIPDWPYVTIQLPIYNELYVVDRLIDAVTRLDYPKDRLEIQMLDDSNDETTDMISSKIKSLESKNIDIKLIRRPDRVGYKAGALKYGLEIAKGEFVAVFDADFMPSKDFLKKTIPHFGHDKKLGVVQTRWEHLNKDYSFLTKLQAFGLDAHFTIEQVGRNAGGHFINFNGTGGVWRKSCILDAGNWQADTLTEDLDLSYRAQRKGWKFQYLEEVGAPAELPATMNALKSQQFRWTKGAAENAKKNLWKTLKCNVSTGTKFHSFFHLLNSTVFLCIMMTALLSIPILIIKRHSPELQELSKFAWLFMISLVSLGSFYCISYFRLTVTSLKSFLMFLITFPLFLSVSMGLSLHNSIAVIEGYLGIKTPFIRTPKFNLIKNSDRWKGNKYLARNISLLTLLEGLLSLYFLAGIIMGFVFNDYGLLAFHFLLFFGFGIVFVYSVKHARFA